MEQTNVKYAYPLRYEGNIFFPIIFFILWFPITIVLMIKNARWSNQKSTFHFEYHGSYFWLYFWAILFFPVVLFLLALKGIDIVEEKIPSISVIETVERY